MRNNYANKGQSNTAGLMLAIVKTFAEGEVIRRNEEGQRGDSVLRAEH